MSESSRQIPKAKLSDDAWSVILGVTVACVAVGLVWQFGSAMTGWIGKPGEWSQSPVAAFVGSKGAVPIFAGTIVSVVVIALLLVPVFAIQGTLASGLVAYVGIAAITVVAIVMSGQTVIKYYNLEYVLWALLLGAVIGNTIGIPRWMRGAVRGEFYIKVGLVLLGMEVLLGKLVVLGLPGILVSWVVTPIVLVSTFWFGQKILRMESPSLNMTIAADMSVCGVSAAIATGAACRAKKEELSLAISMSLAFTAIMMVVMPIVIRAIGMDDIVGGAWLGGTIDSTGAVAAAGAALGERALKIASTVKIIQNVLIGVLAFSVSIYWAYTYKDETQSNAQTPSHGFWGEVWIRFPKFVIGFLAVSLIASIVDAQSAAGSLMVKQSIDLITKELRNWLFALAFVCIGLEMQVATLGPAMRGGKPLILYLVGQCFNLLLTGVMAWFVFGWWFRDSIEAIFPQ